MKNMIRRLLFLLCFTAVSVYSASVPAIDVTVSDKGGKVAFKGKTNAQGTFATGKLAPGNYVVQFNSKSGGGKGNQYTIVVSAGKKKVSADGVSGEKFAAGGVAMKVEVGAGMGVSGQVASAAAAGNDPNVKVVNGVKYYWVKGGTGSNLGGRWLTKEDAKAQGLNVNTMSNEAVRAMQERGYNPQG